MQFGPGQTYAGQLRFCIAGCRLAGPDSGRPRAWIIRTFRPCRWRTLWRDGAWGYGVYRLEILMNISKVDIPNRLVRVDTLNTDLTFAWCMRWPYPDNPKSRFTSLSPYCDYLSWPVKSSDARQPRASAAHIERTCIFLSCFPILGPCNRDR